MRIPLAAVLLACLAVHLSPAHAEGPILGKIIVTDGGTGSNRCTATPFAIGANTKLTVQCDEAVSVGTGVAGCDAGVCLVVPAMQMFPTATGAAQNLTCYGTLLADAGANPSTYYGGWLAVGATGATATCKVFPRSGLE